MAVNRAASSYRGAGKPMPTAASVYTHRHQSTSEPHTKSASSAAPSSPRPTPPTPNGSSAGTPRPKLHRAVWINGPITKEGMPPGPALERVLDLRNRGLLVLLMGFQTPAALREAGVERVTAWLHARGAARPRIWPPRRCKQRKPKHQPARRAPGCPTGLPV